MVQSKNLGITDKILGELALKIETELPEEIIRYVAFGQDVEAKNLVIDWAVQLSTEDLKLLTDVVTGYGGCYTNSKDEHWKDNLSGLKWTLTLKDRVMAKHLHEVRLWRVEDDLPKLKAAKTMDEIIAYQKRSLSRMLDTSCVAALRSEKDLRIKEIAFNVPDDMFLNNFGTKLAALIHGNQGGIDGYIVYDETNTARTSSTSYGPNWYATASSYWVIQFGSGTTAAQRNNYAIQTAFATAPESTKFQCGPGAYAAGVISFGNLITAGGSGTVNEIGLFNICGWQSGWGNFTMMTHDILGSGVAFVAGNPLVGTFAINI